MKTVSLKPLIDRLLLAASDGGVFANHVQYDGANNPTFVLSHKCGPTRYTIRLVGRGKCTQDRLRERIAQLEELERAANRGFETTQFKVMRAAANWKPTMRQPKQPLEAALESFLPDADRRGLWDTMQEAENHTEYLALFD